MTNDEYLQQILEEQTFESSDQELKDLRERRQSIQELLRREFAGTAISIRWGGSMAKGTMIRESYDGDMTCYFNHGDNTAGTSLEEIYNKVAEVVGKEYYVERKTSALRVRDKSVLGYGRDFHIDVVPGRYTDDSKTDVYIHQNAGTKERLKTNLDVHIDHIASSKVIDAIRLMKLWVFRNNIRVKTFVLELLVIKLLSGKKSWSLSKQLEHVWTEFRDHPDSLAVEDPANPNGNDLKPAIDACRHHLSSVARSTLATIQSLGWEHVFGKLKDKGSAETKSSDIRVAVSRVATPSKPWLQGK